MSEHDDDDEILHAAPPGDDDDDDTSDDDGDQDDEEESDEEDASDDEEQDEEEESDDAEEEDSGDGDEEASDEDASDEEASDDEASAADGDDDAEEGDADEDDGAWAEAEGERDAWGVHDDDDDVFGSRDDYPDADDEDFEEDEGDWTEDDYQESAQALFGDHEHWGDTAHDRWLDEGYQLSANDDRYREHLLRYVPHARGVSFYERDGRVVPRGFVRMDALAMLLQLFPGMDTSELDVVLPRPEVDQAPRGLPPGLSAIEAKDTVDLRKFCSPIGDQGQTSRCGAFAYTHALELALLAAGKQPPPLSCSYTMLNTQRIQGDAKDYRYAYKGGDGTSGTWQPGKMLAEAGTCRAELWPNDKPEPHAHEDALATDARNFRLEAECFDIAFDDVKKVLSSGSPVWFFMNTGDKFSDVGRDGVYSAAESPHGDHGCHAMLMVGYVGNYFIVKNSWGTDWGDNGYVYIPKKVLADAEPGFVAVLLRRGAASAAGDARLQRGGTMPMPNAPQRTCPFCKRPRTQAGPCGTCGAPG